jgi:hypothetical protein
MRFKYIRPNPSDSLNPKAIEEKEKKPGESGREGPSKKEIGSP